MINVINNLVDARELHAILESKKDFATWISEKIKQADFKEGEEFTTYKGKTSKVGGRPRQKKFSN